MVLADADDVEGTAVGNLDLVEKAVPPIGGRRWPAYRRIRNDGATLLMPLCPRGTYGSSRRSTAIAILP
jgi:hypothetical protein